MKSISKVVVCAVAGMMCVVALLIVPQVKAQSPPPEQRSVIDCTGTMSSTSQTTVYPGFGDYLQKVGPIGTVYVNGPCPGNFEIWGGDNFTIIGPAEIDGNISIGHSESAVFLRNLTITQSTGDGVDISGSKVSFDSCNVSNNAGNGVSIGNQSHVVIVGSGKFNNNRGYAGGIQISGHSFLNIVSSGPVEIRQNSQSGIWATQADIATAGSTIISDNVNGPGISLLGGARAQIGSTGGAPNVIENNPGGGISVLENSEISLWVCCQAAANLVTTNGKFGISAGFHSQVTLSGAEISDNAGPGVDVYATSQFDFFPGSKNQILRNGFPPNPIIPVDSNIAGLRVDGNSHAWLRGGDVFGNAGPGILVLTNSSVDFEGMNFGSPIGLDPQNTGGIINCDHTSAMTSDLQGRGIAQGVSCPTTGHPPVPR